MTEESISPLVAALEQDQFIEYEALATRFLKENSEEALWVALANAHGDTVDILDRLLAWPIGRAFAAIDLLAPAVRHIRCLPLADAVQLLRFAERVPPAYRYAFSEHVRPHIASAPQLGPQLGEAIRQGDVAGEGAVIVWAGSFSSAAPQQAAEYAREIMANAGDPTMLAVLLQVLDASSPDVAEVLQPVEPTLVRTLEALAPTHGVTAWRAMAAITGYSPSAVQALCRAVAAGEVPAIGAMTEWLHRIPVSADGATNIPIEPLVRDLLRHAIGNDEVRVWVDSAIASLLHRGSFRASILSCVTELGAVEADLAELLPSVFHAVQDQPKDFTKLLTVWLLAEETASLAIRGLLSRCIVAEAPAELDDEAFATAPPASKIVAARRLLALMHNGPTLCRFIASLAETPTLQPDGLELAAQMLNEAFAEFPTATEEFLKTRTRPANRNNPFAAVYRDVYANALRWRRVLALLPELNELRPTEAQLDALRRMRRRMHREIMQKATERSIFASICTNVHLVQGRRFATHTAHGTPQVVAMQERRHTFDLPSSEIADPIGGMLRRAGMLAGSR